LHDAATVKFHSITQGVMVRREAHQSDVGQATVKVAEKDVHGLISI